MIAIVSRSRGVKSDVAPQQPTALCLIHGTVCPNFVAKGSGRGINGTIICKSRPRSRTPYGEVLISEARTCTEGKNASSEEPPG